ncbi:hypothetical protein Aduo_001743 [Ancylostoma duodenale]
MCFRSGDRIEKKKTKTGSDTFSFGSLFGANKGARSKKRRMASTTDLAQSRLPIPDFEVPMHYDFSYFNCTANPQILVLISTLREPTITQLNEKSATSISQGN